MRLGRSRHRRTCTPCQRCARGDDDQFLLVHGANGSTVDEGLTIFVEPLARALFPRETGVRAHGPRPVPSDLGTAVVGKGHLLATVGSTLNA